MVIYTRFGRTVMRIWIKPPNPRTDKQQSNRARFAQAMAAWQGLDGNQKKAYNAKARRLGMTGHNLFISRYMKDHTDGNSCVPPVGGRGQLKRMKGRIQESCAGDTGQQDSTPFSLREKGAGGMRASSLHPAFRSVTAPSHVLSRPGALSPDDLTPFPPLPEGEGVVSYMSFILRDY